MLVAARQGSPLIIGVGSDEYIVASDASAIVEHTPQVIYLNDNEMAVLTPRRLPHHDPRHRARSPRKSQQIEWTLEQIELGGYEHFMLKEIFEQPEALRNCLRGRLDLREGRVVLGGLATVARELVHATAIILTACGTAWHAGLVGEYLFEDLARMPAEVEYASEFRYRNPIIEDGTVVIAISQSGETADTLAALREAKEKGALALGIVNVVGSTIARETDAGVYLHVGPEIGVASTKAFTCQLAVLTMLAAVPGPAAAPVARASASEYLTALTAIPDADRAGAGAVRTRSREIAAALRRRDNWLFLGRGLQYPVALEGALKLKEISYIHAEGLPAAEMKHGPIALINEGMPVVFIATARPPYDKVISNIEEVRSRGGHVIAVATEGDEHIRRVWPSTCSTCPTCPSRSSRCVTVMPLQLLAYHAAVLPRLQRGQAAQPGQERDGGVARVPVHRSFSVCRLVTRPTPPQSAYRSECTPSAFRMASTYAACSPGLYTSEQTSPGSTARPSKRSPGRAGRCACAGGERGFPDSTD